MSPLLFLGLWMGVPIFGFTRRFQKAAYVFKKSKHIVRYLFKIEPGQILHSGSKKIKFGRLQSCGFIKNLNKKDLKKIRNENAPKRL